MQRCGHEWPLKKCAPAAHDVKTCFHVFTRSIRFTRSIHLYAGKMARGQIPVAGDLARGSEAAAGQEIASRETNGSTEPSMTSDVTRSDITT